MQSALTRAWVGANFPKHMSWKRIGWALGLLRSRGYDALRGAAFFMRMSDPGDQLLGTHPPNQARVETVRKAMADLSSP